MNKRYLFRMMGVVFASFMATAVAQTLPDKAPPPVPDLPLPLQRTLKDIPAAGAACRNENVVAKPAVPVAGLERRVDPACAITLEKLSASLGKPGLVLIDTRPKAEYDRMHIDGALNFTASEIRTKQYLSNKLVILLGDGKADQDLYEICGDLKGAGFRQTQVLRGGMLSWALENRAVDGSAAPYADLASLTPGELFRESRIEGNLMIALPAAGKLADVLPTAFAVPSNNFEEIKAFIQKRKKGKSVHNIVLVADERFNKAQLGELAKAVKPEPLFVYTGSEASYRQFLRVQKAMWDKQAKGPTRPRCGAM